MITIAGYPGEKKGDPYIMSGTIKGISDKLIIYDDIDTTPGNSGSPLFMSKSDSNYRQIIVGVHVGG
jgi:V8-like Glu-specific endopeptidase